MAIKFDVTNRWTGAVQFTATIECADDAPLSIKLGLAVKWALGSDADLRDAYLSGANLSGANLSGAKIKDAITLGHPNGWVAQTYLTETGEQRVIVGCQNKTIAEGRAYWGNKENRREIMAMLDYAEALGRIRGWDVKPAETSEAAE